MASVSELTAKRRNAQNQLNAQQTLLDRYEQAYESLRRFSGTVSNSHSNFDSANSQKIALVNNLAEWESKCRCAKEYKAGSNQMLDRVGSKIVGGAYGGLEGLIGIRLEWYRIQIAGCETMIGNLKGAIGNLNGQIAAARAEENM